jgi:uncharacterized membrane protein
LRRAAVTVLGLFFLAAGTAHFARTAAFAAIVPDYLPDPVLLVRISGAAELLLGAMVLVPATRRIAGIGLIALMIAVLPANVQMATHSGDFPQFAPLILWLRLPLQAVLIAWAYWAAGVRRAAQS